jgi:hypothetical protein
MGIAQYIPFDICANNVPARLVSMSGRESEG